MSLSARLALMLLIACLFVGGVFRPDGLDLVRNGDFEKESAYWAFYNANGCQGSGAVDAQVRHEGKAAYRLTNKSGFAPHVYTRIVQFVSGLQPHTTYRISCWGKGEGNGITWIGGGPGWTLRKAFPKGDFDWQEISVDYTTDANPGEFELMVACEDQTKNVWVDQISMKAVATDKSKTDAVYRELDAMLEKVKARRAAIAKSDDPYVTLGTSLVDRFIQRAESGGPDQRQSLGWTRLQLEELGPILDATEARAKAPVKWQRPAKPQYLAGYGHFGQVIKDLPSFPSYGASLIQDGRVGPSAMNEDGSLRENAIDVLKGLDAAATAGIRTDFLLSPHYYPDWSIKKAPDILNGNIGFLGINIDHPETRDVMTRWINAVIPKMKDKAALASICLSNEPVYNQSGRDKHSRPLWIDYLKKRHGDIATLNKVYGSSHRSLEEVPVPGIGMPKELPAQRLYYDWTRFNAQHFADWHAWLAQQIKAILPSIPTHAKGMVFDTFNRDRVFYGMDPELMCAATDIAGCDAYAFPGGGTYDWVGHEMYYDLLHSFRSQPVFNSENHLIPDGSPAGHMSGDHIRSAIWQGGLHHQGYTTIWVWEEAFDPSLAGSIYFRPGCIYGAGTAMLDLQRFEKEVTAIRTAPPQVAILYSPASIFWEPRYGGTVRASYVALSFLGQNITFISEKQLAENKALKVKCILLPGGTHVPEPAMSALRQFVAAGGKLIGVGAENLAFDEYHNRREAGAILAMDPIEPGDAPKLASALRSMLRRVEVPVIDLLTAEGKPAWNVEYRLAANEGKTWLALVNFAPTAQTIKLPKEAGPSPRDLLSGSLAGETIELKPMLPVLLQSGQ